ncbi:hypothetical protein OHS58_33450 [Amycolatopsis sp. NBC_00348]|uniref:hypothetical protein n=1 Tax=Amycolatopsis sp. NBC_00348 TaxID=2975956 RepID=UPI002E253F60
MTGELGAVLRVGRSEVREWLLCPVKVLRRRGSVAAARRLAVPVAAEFAVTDGEVALLRCRPVPP